VEDLGPSSSDSEGWAFDSLGELSLAADCLVRGSGGVLGEAAAEEEPDRQLGAFGGAESSAETVGGLVLIELSGGNVPGPSGFGFVGSTAERVGDASGWLTAGAAAAVAAVVVEAVCDVAELGFHGRAPVVEGFGSGQSPIDAALLINQLLDTGGLGLDLVGQRFVGVVGVADLGFVAASSDGPIDLGECVGGVL